MERLAVKMVYPARGGLGNLQNSSVTSPLQLLCGVDAPEAAQAAMRLMRPL